MVASGRSPPSRSARVSGRLGIVRHEGTLGDREVAELAQERPVPLDGVNSGRQGQRRVEAGGEGIGGRNGEASGGAGEAQAERGLAVSLEVQAEVEAEASESRVLRDLLPPHGGTPAVALPSFARDLLDARHEGGAIEDGRATRLDGPAQEGVRVALAHRRRRPGRHRAVADRAESDEQDAGGAHSSRLRRADFHRSCIQRYCSGASRTAASRFR